MKTSPPDAVLAPDAVAGLALDEHGGEPLLLATRFIFLKLTQLPLHPGRRGRPIEECNLKDLAKARRGDYTSGWIR